MLDSARTSLVTLHTLRDFAEPEIRGKLRKHLSLEAVRNKDRMAVEPILKLSEPSVVAMIQDVVAVQTLVPETYRFWKSNMTGMYRKPVDICLSKTGKLMVVTNCNKIGQLLEVRLHSPADVKVLMQNIEDQTSIDYDSQHYICFVAERGIGNVKFHDQGKHVVLKPNTLSKASLVEELQRRNMPHVGIVEVLRKMLDSYLKERAKEKEKEE